MESPATQRAQWDALTEAGWSIDVGRCLWSRIEVPEGQTHQHLVRSSVGSVGVAGLPGQYRRLPYEVRSRRREWRRLERGADGVLRLTCEIVVHSDVVSAR